jgi:hypothetical protein
MDKDRKEADDRYDVIPSGLILNNTIQIVYNSTNEPAPKVVVEGWPVLDDTDFVPVLKREMAPADIEYELNVWFDVRIPYYSFYLRSLHVRRGSHRVELMSRHMMMEPTEGHSIMCTSSLPISYSPSCSHLVP